MTRADPPVLNLKRFVEHFAAAPLNVISDEAPARITVISFGPEGSGYDIHPASEAVLILDGALTLEIEGVTRRLVAGDFLRIPAGSRHRVISGEPGMLLLFETA